MIEKGSKLLAPSRVDTVLRGLRRMEELETRRRISGHVVMWVCHRWGAAGEDGLVCAARREVTVCLFLSVWVGDVSGFSRSEGRRVSYWRRKWVRSEVAMG
jgi:hypothetical protein